MERSTHISMKGGFQRSENEPALYVKYEGTSDILIVSLYIDDLVILEVVIK